MPPWALPLIKNLLGGLFSWFSGQKAQANKERAEGIAAERESIRRAAAEERKIASAMASGVQVKSTEDWNEIVEEWDW